MCQACSQQILDTGLFFRFAVLTATNLQRHGLRKEEIKHYTVGKVGAKGMSNKKPLSEAQKKANAKYLSKFAEMRIRLEPDYYEEIKRHAESMGESGAAFAKRAIAETMERDRQTKNTDKN